MQAIFSMLAGMILFSSNPHRIITFDKRKCKIYNHITSNTLEEEDNYDYNFYKD